MGFPAILVRPILAYTNLFLRQKKIFNFRKKGTNRKSFVILTELIYPVYQLLIFEISFITLEISSLIFVGKTT